MNERREREGRVEQLLELSANGPTVLADLLDECVRQVRAVQAAREALGVLPPEEVREAISRRRERLTDGEGP